MRTTLAFLLSLLIGVGAPAWAGGQSNQDKPQTLSGGFNPLSNYRGHFAGSESDHIGDDYHKRPIHADFDLSSRNPSITALDTNNAPVVDLDFVKFSGHEIQLRISALQDEVKTLEREDSCFADAVHQTIMCFYDDGMSLDVTSDAGDPVISVSLTRFAVETPVEDEKPQAFTLKTAVDRALKMNFDGRIEFEHVVQAQQTARKNYMNLLPHLTINSVAALIAPSVSSLLTVVGDLVPFLLPSRWMQAKMAGYQAQAESQALILMRLDTASTVEGLFYSYEHDRGVQATYKKLLDTAAVVREEIRMKEKLGQYPKGSTDNIDSIIVSMQEDYSLFDQILTEDRAAISQSLGFFSHEAVSAASIGDEPDGIDTAAPIDIAAVTDIALKTSLELKQLDDLAAAAKENKNSVYFNWLDPVGDPTINLGFSLKANLAVAQSQLRELAIRRAYIQSDLDNRSLNACTEYNQALKTYALTKQGVAVNQRRLDQILNFVKVETDVDLFHVLDIIQDVLAANVSQADAISTYRVSRGKVDRLLLQGFYVHPDKPVEKVVVFKK